jgi:hypothetical protein
MRGASVHFWIGGAVAAGLLWLSLRGVDVRALGQALASARYWLLAPAMALTLLAFYLRALRWGVLLRTVKPMPPGSLYAATLIGFMANNLLPARLGEFVRAWALGRSEQVSRSTVFATVVVERIVDVFCLLLLFAAALLVHPFPPEAQGAGYAALGLNLALVAGLLWVERNPDPLARFSAWLAAQSPARLRPRVEAMGANFLLGVGVLRHGRAMLEVAGYSVLLYGVTILGIHTCLAAFPFAVPWTASLVLLVTLTLGFVVAPTPGYVGSVQVACRWSLLLFGVGPSAAFSFSLFYHASQFVPITAAGLWCLARRNLTLSDATGAAGKEAKEIA